MFWTVTLSLLQGLRQAAMLFGLTLAIFMGFRNTVSYQRFDEARHLWGQLLNSARALVSQALESAGLPPEAVQLVPTTDRAAVGALITMPEFVDVIVPRGGKSLIERVSRDAKVPVIKHLDGVCHVYVDSAADPDKAIRVCDNAKTQRYSPCNTMETLLVHDAIAARVLPPLAAIYRDKGVELRGDAATRALLEAVQQSAWQPQTLLLYANHLHDNDRWPMGNSGDGIALPPVFDATLSLRPCSLPLSLAQQRDKAMALGMMHDLQPRAALKRRLRRSIQQLLAGRKSSPYGENEFFRKAVRRHELFWQLK